METKDRPDQLDKEVYSATYMIRRMYEDACHNAGIPPRRLTPVTIMQRSVQ